MSYINCKVHFYVYIIYKYTEMKQLFVLLTISKILEAAWAEKIIKRICNNLTIDASYIGNW